MKCWENWVQQTLTQTRDHLPYYCYYYYYELQCGKPSWSQWVNVSFYRWYFGNIKRPDAENFLKAPQNEDGSFLVRDSSKGQFALSVRDGDIVKHYRILQTDAGDYFIARTLPFATLTQLVEHYSKSADGLCNVLKNPCLKVWSCVCWCYNYRCESDLCMYPLNW